MIIAMILVVLIMSYSIGLAKSTIGIKQNILLQLDYQEHQANQQRLRVLASDYAITGQNPYVEDAPGQDFAFQKTIDNKIYNQDVWYTTGCPIPNRNDGNGETYFSLIDKTPADLSQEFKIYNDNGLVETKTIAEKCGLSETDDQAYFVYPTPLVKKAHLATSDCLSNYALNSYVKDELVNPLDHPCYWSKLDAGTSKTITLNDWGRDFSNVQTLILRVRPTCPRGQSWCTDEERYSTFFDYSIRPYKLNNYDISPTALSWELNFNDGEYLFGSTKGRIADIKTHFQGTNVNCEDQRFSCRKPESSEYTLAELQSKVNFDLVELGNTIGYIDIRNQLIAEEEGQTGLFRNQDDNVLRSKLNLFLNNQRYFFADKLETVSNSLTLRIVNELRFIPETLKRFEFQIISDLPFKKLK